MDQKSFNPPKIKKVDSTLSGLYHGGGFLLMWIILRSGLISWLFTPFWDAINQNEWTNRIPFHYLFLIALSIFPAIFGGYAIAKIRQVDYIRDFVTSYAVIFVFVFGLMTSPMIFYHIAYWQGFDLYYYPQIVTWVFNFVWGSLFGGLIVYFVSRRWELKLPRKQAILLAAIGFGFAGLFTNGYYALFSEFYYWVSVLRIVGVGFLGGILLGVALNANPEKTIHGHFYQRSTYDY